jgi:dihydropteroate synthase
MLSLPGGERIFGTAAAVAMAAASGAAMLRVHDVKEMRQVAAVAACISAGGAFEENT